MCVGVCSSMAMSITHVFCRLAYQFLSQAASSSAQGSTCLAIAVKLRTNIEHALSLCGGKLRLCCCRANAVSAAELLCAFVCTTMHGADRQMQGCGRSAVHCLANVVVKCLLCLKRAGAALVFGWQTLSTWTAANGSLNLLDTVFVAQCGRWTHHLLLHAFAPVASTHGMIVRPANRQIGAALRKPAKSLSKSKASVQKKNAAGELNPATDSAGQLCSHCRCTTSITHDLAF